MKPLEDVDAISKSHGIIDRFLSNVAKRPNHTAIIVEDTNEKVSYGELLDLMEQFRGAFEAQGVLREDIVAILLPPGKEFVAAFYALASLGATSLLLSTTSTEYEIESRLEDAKPVGVVAFSRTVGVFRKTLEDLGGLKNLLVLGSKTSDTVDISIHYSWLEDFSEKKSRLISPPGNPMISLHYTYKGLGYPLGVLHSYRAYAQNLEGIEQIVPVQPEDVSLSLLPMHTILGIVLLVMYPLNTGSTLVMVTNARYLMKIGNIALFEKYKVKYTCMVPTILRRMVKEAKDRGPENGFDFNPELMIACGGEYTYPDLAEDVQKTLGIRMVYGYGLTEAQITLMLPWEDSDRLGSVGRAFSRNCSVTIVDDDGNELAPGEIGQIAATGPIVCDGYMGKPEENARFFSNNKMLTGDIGFSDSDGYIYFVGRMIPITKISAQMVDLKEIDHILKKHPAVMDAHTVSYGKDGGKHLIATVSVQEEAEVKEEDLQDFCRKYLSRFKIPGEVMIRKCRS